MREFTYKIRLIIAIIIFVSIISSGVFLFLNPQVLHNLPIFKIGLISVVTILLAALLFGRIGCSLVCPFGIFQEIVSLFFDRQNEKRPNWIGKYIILLLFFIVSGIFAVKYKKITDLNINLTLEYCKNNKIYAKIITYSNLFGKYFNYNENNFTIKHMFQLNC